MSDRRGELPKASVLARGAGLAAATLALSACTPRDAAGPAPHESASAGVSAPPKEELAIRAVVLYPPSVATPPPTARPALDEVAAFLRAHADVLAIEIVGFSDPDEPEGVAYARANLVRSSLVARGIADARLVVRSREDAPPEGEPDGEAARRRRVEFRVLRRSGE